MQWKYQPEKSAATGKQLPPNALAELGHPEDSEKKVIRQQKHAKPATDFSWKLSRVTYLYCPVVIKRVM